MWGEPERNVARLQPRSQVPKKLGVACVRACVVEHADIQRAARVAQNIN